MLYGYAMIGVAIAFYRELMTFFVLTYWGQVYLTPSIPKETMVGAIE